MLCSASHRPEQPLEAEKEDEKETRHYRRYREGQVDQRHEERFAWKPVFRYRPRRGDTKKEIKRNRCKRDDERQPDGGKRVRVG